MADGDHVRDALAARLGPAPPPRRRFLLGSGALVVAGFTALFSWQSARSAEVARDELRAFRQAMAAQCSQQSFARPALRGLNSLYANSVRMQAVVHEQFNSLQRGHADCERIIKILKSVDFPLE